MLVDELHTTDRESYRERNAVAAVWCEKQGDPTQAIRHWLESEQPESAWNVVRKNGLDLYYNGQADRVRELDRDDRRSQSRRPIYG
jgi:ATP/maltotriose-dependent transcriptional regulator MalT